MRILIFYKSNFSFISLITGFFSFISLYIANPIKINPVINTYNHHGRFNQKSLVNNTIFTIIANKLTKKIGPYFNVYAPITNNIIPYIDSFNNINI